MVWWLAPVNATAPGPFYFTAPGIYTVGRKDCSITIQTDKTISRIHAEISLEALGSADKQLESLPRCRLLLKDLSKFGTFVKKEAGSRPLNSLPDNVAVLKEGDVITFGTNKAVFRLNYNALVLCMSPSAFQSIKEVRSKAEAVGAYVFEQWNSQCTHLLVEEASPVKDLVIKAVINKKPVLSLEWLQALVSESSPRNQLPSLSSYVPTLRIDCRGVAVSVTIAEPHAREEILNGYTVFMEMGHLYQHHDLPPLVHAAGGAVISFTRDNLKDVACLGSLHQRGLLLLPTGKVSRKDWLGTKILSFIQHLHPISEDDLLRSLLTAKLEFPPVHLSADASADTDETVNEEDPELEDDSTSSAPQDVVQVVGWRLPSCGQAVADSPEESIVKHQLSPILQTSSALQAETPKISRVNEKKSLISSRQGNLSNMELANSQAALENFRKQPGDLAGAESPVTPMRQRIKKEEATALCDEVKAEVIFSSGLMVLKDWNVLRAEARNETASDFKRFRKGIAPSGNSFTSLVPFAKDPYRESDYGREMGDYIKQEKKRKEAELLAEDLFNTEQLKQRRVTAAEAAKEAGGSTSRKFV